MASDRDTLAALPGMVVHDDELHHAIDQSLAGLYTDWGLSEGLPAPVTVAVHIERDLRAAGWRPPAREITTAAEADALPVGTILFHVACPDPDPCIWRRACGASEEDELGGTFDHIHWEAWGDMETRYDSEDLECHADSGGPLLAVYVPTEEAESRG